MGYIGRTPTGSILTSADIADGSISTDKLADDAVDNTKLDLADTYAFTGTVSGAGGGIFESQLLHVQDQKADGTGGGTGTAGAFNIRDLNTVLTNEITGASLSSNQITLPSGTYYAEGTSASFDSNFVKTTLYNVTDSTYELIGMNVVSDQMEIAPVSGRFTISAQKVFEVRHFKRFNTNLGASRTEDTVIEVYTDIKIWKVA